ncbi:MAG: DsbA family protein, partial [Solirubrobacteraceae bacterium]
RPVHDALCELRREPRFANAPDASQRGDTRSRHQLPKLAQLALLPNEAGDLGGQVGRSARGPRREDSDTAATNGAPGRSGFHMGKLIVLAERLADRARAQARATFFFDLACPFSYLAAERVERLFGEVEWVPVAGPLHAYSGGVGLRAAAEARARELRLPLVWPERFPATVNGALRSAMRATQAGVGARFALSAARFAFCGGFDLEDPEILAEAAAASGFALAECLEAAGAEALDGSLHATARGLVAHGVGRLPAVRVSHGFFAGESLLSEEAAVSRVAAGYESWASHVDRPSGSLARRVAGGPPRRVHSSQ